jgi:SPP1 family predicted phage head-tail adaptor
MITDYFTMDIVVQRKTSTSNGFGGRSATWAEHTEFKGYIDYASGREEEIAGQKEVDNATHILLCETGQDIEQFDRVVCDGKTYNVLHIDTPKNNHMEVLLEIFF